MRFTKKSQYGLRAMAYLAKVSRRKKVCPLKEVSEKEDIPFDFLEKIIRELEKAGLVRAKKGVRGGYFLAKQAKKITAGEVIKTLEKSMAPVNCTGCPMSGRCATKSVWKEVKSSLDATLDSINLEDLIKKQR